MRAERRIQSGDRCGQDLRSRYAAPTDWRTRQRQRGGGYANCDVGKPAVGAASNRSDSRSNNHPLPIPPSLETKTPAAWKGTEALQQRWLAAARIPCGDLTLYSGNGGAGKTETAAQLLVSVTDRLGDWLGCVVEAGPALFLSCEEPEPNIRDRIDLQAPSHRPARDRGSALAFSRL
jgi:hypothetical protein